MTGERRVLVVEDDDALRDLLVSLLTDEGFAVRGAAHGVEALTILRDWACHVIVMDLEMPVMNGQDLLARLRSRAAWEAIPVIVATSNHRTTQRARSLGASAVLLKPFDIQALTDLVGQFTEHQVASHAAR